MAYKKYKPKKTSAKAKSLAVRNAIRAGIIQGRRSSGTVATAGQVQQAAAVENKLYIQKRRLIFPQERKWFAYNGSADFGIKYTGQNYYGAYGNVINAITQGTSDNQRIGSRIFMTGVRIQYQVKESNTSLSDGDNIFDLYLIYYKSGTYATTMTLNRNSYDTTNAALQPTEIAQFLLPDTNYTGGTSNYAMVTTNSLRNPGYLANYRVLAHQRCSIPSGAKATALNQVTGTMSWKGALPVTYMDTTAATVSGPGKLVILAVCNDNGVTRADPGTGYYLTLGFNAITYFVDN